MDILTYRKKKESLIFSKQTKETPVGSVSQRTIPTSIGETRLFIYRPFQKVEGSLPVFINLHGGGFVLGFPEVDDPYCRELANKTGCIVINVDYALAPENKFPAAVYECYDVVKWIYEHPAELQIDRKKIAIGGHSAGGNLAAAVCLLAKERQEFSLIYQVIDYAPLNQAADPYKKATGDAVADNNSATAKMYEAWYFKTREETWHPLASPVLAEDLSGLPPALIITAEYDMLCEDGRLYAERLKEAGVTTIYKMFEKCGHGFTHEIYRPADDEWQREAAEEAWNLMYDELRKSFSKEG